MKKLVIRKIATVVALICAATTTPIMAQAVTSPRWGDVNSDGAVTVEDAQAILQYYTTVVLAGNQWSGDFNLQIADVDLVEGVTIEDAQLVLQKYVVEGLAGEIYLLPVESTVKQTDHKVFCTCESGWLVYTGQNKNTVLDVVREGEFFEILNQESESGYVVKLESGKTGYVDISTDEFDEYFIIYTRQSVSTEPAETTTTTSTTTTTITPLASTTSKVATTTTSASETTTSKEAATETKVETTTSTTKETTTTAVNTTSKVATTTTSASETTTSKEVATETKVETTTSTTKETTTTAVNTTSNVATTTTSASETTTSKEAATETKVETTTATTTTTAVSFEKGDVIEFTMTAWKVYDETYEQVIAWAPNGTQFTIKEVHDLKGGDSKENQQVYLVEFHKDGVTKSGYILNAPEGYFKKVGEVTTTEPLKAEAYETFEKGDVIRFEKTAYKVYNHDYTTVRAWISGGTVFTIKDVTDITGGDSAPNQQVYYVEYELDGMTKLGWIWNAPAGYFTKIDSVK